MDAVNANGSTIICCSVVIQIPRLEARPIGTENLDVDNFTTSRRALEEKASVEWNIIRVKPDLIDTPRNGYQYRYVGGSRDAQKRVSADDRSEVTRSRVFTVEGVLHFAVP
jgi:hypothetical protein